MPEPRSITRIVHILGQRPVPQRNIPAEAVTDRIGEVQMRDRAGIDLIMDELGNCLQGLIALCARQRAGSCGQLIEFRETAGREGTATGEMAAK